MKGRSYRFSNTEPHEDWVDGSWTVDCVCGVNFDDGEEMVDCDDCGVWVHTRCSGYVKGEDFSCDKCKSKNNINDSEETEVAQLLVELPTKTLRMENSCTRSVPLKRPFRLWTEIPMEERVHVQGIPGGEPALFEGLSLVFSQELWKCTGYVPKKFNFKYKEFPCWDEKEEDKTENTCENGHEEENGVGVLFSMSKKNVTDAPASALVGTRNLDDKGINDLKLGAKDTENWDSGEAEMKHSQGAFKKDKSLLRPWITNKRRKELFGATKEGMKKKKVDVGGKEEDNKKGYVGKTESHKDIDPEGFSNKVGIIKSEKSKKHVLKESADGGHGPGPALNNGNDESGNTAIGVEWSREQNLSDVHANGGGKQEEEKAGHHFRIVLKSSATSDSSVLEEKGVPCIEANKEERRRTIADTRDDNAVDSPERLQKPCPGSTVGITQEVEEKKCNYVWGNVSSRHQKDVFDASAGGAVDQQTLDSIDSKVAETSTSQIFGALEFNKITQGNSRVNDHKLQPVDRVSEGITSGTRDRAIELKQESVISEGCMLAQKDMLETKTGSGLPQDPSKSCRLVPSNISGYDRPKVVVCIGKSSSSSATEKSSRSDHPKHSTSKIYIPESKQQPIDGDANDEDCVSAEVAGKHSSNSGTFQKSEKPGQSIFQSSKNPVQSILSLPPNSSTPLSDEMLALRLHHELNSSPRVPRVPRMRQPGSLPPSPTASSFKRTSSSGSKDHVTFSRRKNRHTCKESFRSSRDDDRCIRGTKTCNSPDWRAQESGSRGSVCSKGEDNETLKTSCSSRKVQLPPTSTTSTSSGSCSSNDLNEQNMSSPHSSPRNISDNTPVHRTLPDLINEIMSKGKRMTCEELSNAVLPHWPHLRKHNGERYAYSSHSQAVLDCLRNRHEWARLVDRGPKTNSSKKKQKLDVEESDENGSSEG